MRKLKSKLDVSDYEWETDQSDYVNNYKKELEEHSKNFIHFFLFFLTLNL